MCVCVCVCVCVLGGGYYGNRGDLRQRDSGSYFICDMILVWAPRTNDKIDAFEIFSNIIHIV